MQSDSILYVLLSAAAFLYAAVGHGGASSYIAVLTYYHYPPEQVRFISLILNIIISGISFLYFRKSRRFQSDLFLSLIVLSIPAAFLGGTIKIDPFLYKKILGVSLLFPVARLFNLFPVSESQIIERKLWMSLALGLCIGFLSGLIGIGGGIILSPILLILGWADVKETSAISALFIFLNSIAGLIGGGASKFQLLYNEQLLLLLPLTIVGGVAGAYLGARRFKIPMLRYLLAIVLLVAASKFLVG